MNCKFKFVITYPYIRDEHSHDYSLSVFCKDIDNLYKWLTFRPKGLYQNQILYASGFDEGLWVEKPAIYIDYQYVCKIH